MYRFLASLALFLAATTAWAQTAYDPTVAYTKLAGSTTYLYLANGDGTHAVSVASSANGFAGIDLAPGGNRVAFSDKTGLKVLNYSASNTGIVVNSVTLLVAGIYTSSPDFSYDGNRVLYYNYETQASSGGVYAVSAGGGTPVLLFLGPGYAPRWLRPTSYGNAFVFMKHFPVGTGDVYEIWKVLLDGSDNVVGTATVLSTASQAFKGIEDFDTARTRDALLITANYPTGIRIVDFDLRSGAVADKAVNTYRVHYSADDSRIISTDLQYLGSKTYVTSIDLGTSFITRLTKAGNFGSIDARP